jgi:environmental stress-induced protein Ves
MPWKNGQGATREILVHPEGASLDGFMWRISMAQVNAPGAFSVFPGCDRILCVVNGGPLLLAVEDAEPVRLGVDSPPFHFAADAAAEVTALDEPVLDFNVMVRRSHYRAHVDCRRGAVELPACGDTRAVCIREGTARTEKGEVLRSGDTVLVDGRQTKIAADDDTVLYVVTLIAQVRS